VCYYGIVDLGKGLNERRPTPNNNNILERSASSALALVM
jgi:hypothetical protein